MKTNSRKKEKSWFRIKGYPHIGYPLTIKDKAWVTKFVQDSDKVARYAFLPFIHKKIVSPKYKKTYDDTGSIENNGYAQFLKPKTRHLYYANHFDAQIYAYYADILNKKYEILVQQKKSQEVITAYRKIPLDPQNEESRNKCNIDFAHDIFCYIKDNAQQDLVVIAFDIKGFFDNLNHKLLKQVWCKTLQKSTLPKDHYNIFKHITRFSYIEELEMFQLFKDKIIIKTKSNRITRKQINRIEYMKNNGAIAYCEKKEVADIRKKGLIHANNFIKDGSQKLRDYGICQGSPISAILANMYMLDFDEFINHEVIKRNGIYRRYSDDMVIVCSKQHKTELIELFTQEITQQTKLEIQDTKTQIFHFNFIGNRLHCFQEFNGVINKNSKNRNFEYLGFSFDGKYTYLKAITLTRYYQKMRIGVKRCSYYLNTINNDTNGEMFTRRLYKRYSYVGAQRRIKYKQVDGTKNKWKDTRHYDWGNFITYAYLASDTLTDNKIRHQVKNHFQKLQDEINKKK